MSIHFVPLFAFLPLVASIAYFCYAPRHQALLQRLATSAHGASVCALWAAWILLISYDTNAQVPWGLFGLLCFIPLALMCYALWKYAGPAWLHLLQVLNVIWLLVLGIAISIMA